MSDKIMETRVDLDNFFAFDENIVFCAEMGDIMGIATRGKQTVTRRIWCGKSLQMEFNEIM